MFKILVGYTEFVCVICGGIVGAFLAMWISRLMWAEHYAEPVQWALKLEMMAGFLGWVAGTGSVLGWLYVRWFASNRNGI